MYAVKEIKKFSTLIRESCSTLVKHFMQSYYLAES